jgi:hypothetical protein
MATGAPTPSGGYRNAPTYAPSGGSDVPPAPSWNNDWSKMLVVDLEQLRLAKNAIDAAASDVHTYANKIDRVLDDPSLGAHPWGEDPLGQSFEGQYKGIADNTRQAIDMLGEIFQNIDDGIGNVRALFAKHEATAQELARAV